MKILLADDHSVIRQGVSLMLRDAFDSLEIEQADSFYETLNLVKDIEFDLLLLDINLPGGDTDTMIADVRGLQSDLKVLMFSAYDEDQYGLRYYQAGAQGYVNKLSSEETILQAVNAVLDGGLFFGNSLGAPSVKSINPLETLSARELEIAGMLVKGEGNLEISNKLGIGMSTVSTYKSRIFEKLGVTNVLTMAEKYWHYKN
ncbi:MULTISPECIES: response regulator transcription factor [Flavobacterium]|uniref:Response regulator n=1 Tax=Flavobacterium suzhouense TaxID=1529638 RepID=A0ABW5NVS1_9FLAO|nr:response regulator transcription factor [Flavobacterium sp. AG291]RDI16099.1 LuxR family two component transcriptional regulator [Flavobacterium sp. AG291]